MKRIFFQVPFLVLLSLATCIATPPDYLPDVGRPDTPSVPTTTSSAQLLLQPTPLLAWDWSSLNTLSEEIAFISNRSGLAEIWILNLRTGLERRLTETDCGDASSTGQYIPGVQYFAWAPDGQRITYLVTCAQTTNRALLSVIGLESKEVIIVGRADDTSYPSWAPSGDRLVFTRGSLLIADLGGRGEPEIELFSGTGWDDRPEVYLNAAWSPSGDHIAYQGPFVGLPGAGWRTYVSIVDIAGNHVVYEPESPNRGAWILEPSRDGLTWSNDGHYLAIATVRDYVAAVLALAEVSDQTATRMGAGLQQDLSGTDRFGPGFYNPVFSPDDETLYFVSLWSDAEDTRQPFGTVYSVLVQELRDNPSPGVKAVSPEDQLAGYPSLSPDGRWLLYAVKVEKTSELWLQATDGTFRQRIVGDGFVNTQPAWRPLDE